LVSELQQAYDQLGQKIKKGGWAHELQASSLTIKQGQCRMNIMKEINYKNKKIKLPWKFTNKTLTTDMENRTNRFSGQSIELPNFAAEVYDVTMQFNHRAEEYDAKHGMGTASLWPQVRQGLDWFRQYFAKEYMVLLD
jgi:hypothetical protein